MILILSEESDLATNRVIDWLLHYNQKYVRINFDSRISIKEVSISNKELDFEININDELYIKASEVSAFWYRKQG